MATSTSNDSDRTDELPPDVIEELLSREHRRKALEILRERGDPVVVSDLATAILADKRDTRPSNISSEDRETLCKELYTDHLPKLTATGIVEYDSMTETVTLRRPDVVTDRLD